jgi:hypothetical protein
MSAKHQSRRRRNAAPLFLAIVDHDTRRFTVEGPVVNDEAWVIEIARAQKAGRRITFSLTEETAFEDAVALWGNIVGYERWPSRSIVLPYSELESA